MLSEQQKNELLGLIVLFIGSDPSISSGKPYFNNATVDVVERMIEANINCNQSIKELIINLISGGRALSSGWLKRVLGGAESAIKAAELKGYGCQVATKSKWKPAIITSTY